MDQATHNKIVSFIWGIADDVLRDLFKRGKYPDVILPMCVIRRMDAVLESTKRKVLDTQTVRQDMQYIGNSVISGRVESSSTPFAIYRRQAQIFVVPSDGHERASIVVVRAGSTS